MIMLAGKDLCSGMQQGHTSMKYVTRKTPLWKVQYEVWYISCGYLHLNKFIIVFLSSILFEAYLLNHSCLLICFVKP